MARARTPRKKADYSLPTIYHTMLVREGADRLIDIHGPDEAVDIIAKFLKDHDREHFVVLMLDARGRAIGIHTASVGTINMALVSLRDIFKAPLLANASSIIVGHNHPSGDPTPSPEDLEVTQRLVTMGHFMDIPVLDHIIVGHGSTHSISRNSGMPKEQAIP